MKTDKFDFSEDFKEIAERAEKQNDYEAITKELKDCTESFEELETECRQLRKEFPTYILSLSSVSAAVNDVIAKELPAKLQKLLDEKTAEVGKTLDRKADAVNRHITTQDYHVSMPVTTFSCILIALVFLAVLFGCTAFFNYEVFHDIVLWKLIGATTFIILFGMSLTILVYHKLKR